jgi:hypothetical protein
MKPEKPSLRFRNTTTLFQRRRTIAQEGSALKCKRALQGAIRARSCMQKGALKMSPRHSKTWVRDLLRPPVRDRLRPLLLAKEAAEKAAVSGLQ